MMAMDSKPVSIHTAQTLIPTILMETVLWMGMRFFGHNPVMYPPVMLNLVDADGDGIDDNTVIDVNQI